MPKEETFSVQLKYIDVTRSTHTDLGVVQEKRIDDHWNVDSSKHLSDSWRGFTKFTLLQEKPPKEYMWSGERLTKIQTITRPDYVCPEVWTKIGKAAQNRQKQEWAKEKPKLDNARTLRGIYFIDPDDRDVNNLVTLINITVLVRLLDCVRVSRCPMEATVSTRCFELFPHRVSDGASHCDQCRSYHKSRYGGKQQCKSV